jgi:hypothetical protein
MVSDRQFPPSKDATRDEIWDANLLGISRDRPPAAKSSIMDRAFVSAWPVANGSSRLFLPPPAKLLAPLAGLFVALLLTAAAEFWPATGSSSDSTVVNSLRAGHVYLGAVGAVMTDSVATGLQDTASRLAEAPFEVLVVLDNERPAFGRFLAQAAGSGNQFVETLSRSGQAFFQGVKEIFSLFLNNFQRVAAEADQILADMIIFLQDIFRTLYHGILTGIGFLTDRLEEIIDNWFLPQAAVSGVGSINGALTDWLSRVVETVQDWWQKVLATWRAFLIGGQKDHGFLIDQEVKTDVKEIKRDVKSLLNYFTGGSTNCGAVRRSRGRPFA